MKVPSLLFVSFFVPGLASADPPVNDAFTAALPLTEYGGLYSSTVLPPAGSATFEPGEETLPLPSTPKWAGSSWWTFTTSVTGTYGFYNFFYGTAPHLQVYTGTSLASLTAVPASQTLFRLEAGQLYHVRNLTIAGWYPDNVNITRYPALDLRADNAAQAENVAWPADFGISTTSRLSTVGATAEPGEPAHGSAPAQRSVWWKFTAGTTGTAGIAVSFPFSIERVAGTVGIYEGASLEALSPIASVANGGVGVYPVVAGKSYLVAANDSQNVFGPVDFTLTPVKLDAFPNDSFAARTFLGPALGSSFSRYPAGDTWSSASLEPGEPPLPAGNTAVTGTLWWECIPADTGWYVAQVSGDLPETLEIFTGSALHSLHLVPPVKIGEAPPFSSRYYHFQAGEPVIFRRTLSPGNGLQSFGLMPAKPYDAFLLDAGLPPAQWGLDANPASDGYNNLTKFLYGLDASKSAGQDPNAGHLPHLSPGPGGGMEIVFTVDQNALDYLDNRWEEFYVRFSLSSDLSSWTGFYVSFDFSGADGGRFKEYRFPLPVDAPRFFFTSLIFVGQDDD